MCSALSKWRLVQCWRFPTAGCFRITGLCWGILSCHGHWLPLSSDLTPFPDTFLCRQPMARWPAWPQTKQWGQLTLLCCIQLLHLPLVSDDGRWGRAAGGQGSAGVTELPEGFEIWVRCFVSEDACGVSSIIAAQLACNSVSTFACLSESLLSSWAVLTVTGRGFATVPRRFSLSASLLIDLVIWSKRKSSLTCCWRNSHPRMYTWRSNESISTQHKYLILTCKGSPHLWEGRSQHRRYFHEQAFIIQSQHTAYFLLLAMSSSSRAVNSSPLM